MASLTLVPASGSITAKRTFVRVTVSGADDNDASSYDVDNYPTEDEKRYYLLFDAPSGTDDKRSYEFNVSADGDHVFNNFMFDVDGTWTVRLRDASDDSDVTTASVVVNAPA